MKALNSLLPTRRAAWIVALLILAMALALAWVSVDSREVRAAKRALEGRLVDADSVQYRNVRTYSEGVVCGEVNAKNRLGGYAGYQAFVFNGDEDGEVVVNRPAHAEYYCNNRTDKRRDVLARELESSERVCSSLPSADVSASLRHFACEDAARFKAKLAKP